MALHMMALQMALQMAWEGADCQCFWRARDPRAALFP